MPEPQFLIRLSNQLSALAQHPRSDASWVGFVECASPALRHIAAGILHQNPHSQDVDDILQNTMIEIFKIVSRAEIRGFQTLEVGVFGLLRKVCQRQAIHFVEKANAKKRCGPTKKSPVGVFGVLVQDARSQALDIDEFMSSLASLDREILVLLQKGYRRGEIATELHIADRTLFGHIRQIRAKATVFFDFTGSMD